MRVVDIRRNLLVEAVPLGTNLACSWREPRPLAHLLIDCAERLRPCACMARCHCPPAGFYV